MVSLDIESLFSNITLDAALESISSHWDSIEPHCTMNREEFLECARLIFGTTYCQFQGRFFLQIKGAPMEGDASPIIAEMVVDDLLDKTSNTLNNKPIIVKKYVDDLFCIVHTDLLLSVDDTFNAQDRNINFNYER